LGENTFEERFLIKWSDQSFLHCSWELEADLLEQVEGAKTFLSSFFRKSENGLFYTSDERCDGDYFDPAWVQIDRILEVHPPEEIPERTPKEGELEAVTTFGIVMDKKDPSYKNGTGRQFLIKWGSTPYTDSTYEFERDLIMCDVEYEGALEAFEERSTKPSKAVMKTFLRNGEETLRRTYKLLGDEATMNETLKEKKVGEYQKELADHVYPNGGQLRDYQAEGVTWLIANYVNKRSSILADEMGLGKTLQTCSFVNLVATRFNQRGPFLVVAPLSTLEHWKREFDAWTNLNAFIYHGSQKDRELIRENEMAYEIDRPQNVAFNSSYLKKCHKNCRTKAEKIWMAQVVITTPEMLITDDFGELFAIPWEILVVDEAHRLKSATSRLAINLRNNKFKFKHTLLLTGTPIQNNMNELWALLNFIDPDKFLDDKEFLEQFGDMKSTEKIDELHEAIRPYILRRLKEDVEKSVPPKEETLIEVELTIVQKQYYRALYEKNVGFLSRNKKKALDGPSISNLAMQLRKCCNHPFLLRGVEEEMRPQQDDDMSEGDFLAKSSGKLVLLDKLLPRMKADGHRILVFSQFKIMLDILEDYLNVRNHKTERIDGSITGKKRQQAIDRFQAKEKNGKEPPFIMLLSTRAGGVGINLTAADTVIIFDSDWNPQNDLQAQARCHRIGQTKNVKVYRLLTRKTYEMQMFHMSSMKMGLDQAVLQGFESNSGDAVMSKDEIEKLLRHGAYDIFNEEKAGTAEAESKGFIEEDIETILARRTKTVVHDNTGSKSSAAGGKFSKASFKAPSTPSADGKKAGPVEDIDVDDPDFWQKMVGEGKESKRNDVLLSGQKRKRRAANYSEKAYEEKFTLVLGDNADSDDGKKEGESSDSESDDSFSEGDEESTQNVRERKRWGRKDPTMLSQWHKSDAEKVAKGLQTYGYGHLPWSEFCGKIQLHPKRYELDEVKRLCWSLIFMVLKEGANDDLVASKRRAERAAEKAQQEIPSDKPVGGGVLASEPVVKKVVDRNDTIETCFQKLWETHQSWLGGVMNDAAAYGKSNAPRSEKALHRALNPSAGQESAARKGLNALFAENVWPALRSRNWKAVSVATEKGEAKRYEYNGEQYKTTKSVLASVPKIHPELANMVETILSSVQLETEEKQGGVEPIDFDKVTQKPGIVLVTNMLNQFGPLQLLADRSGWKKVSLQKRILTTCAYLSVAHTYLNITGVSDCSPNSREKIAKLISLDRRTMLPHPSWTVMHDAVLIFAITRHGWVEHDSVCREITNDNDVKWGSPFEIGDVEPKTLKENKEVMSEDEFVIYRNAAMRAANFLSAESAIVDTVKGFKKKYLVSTYCLQQAPNSGLAEQSEGSPPTQPLWVVDVAELRNRTGVSVGSSNKNKSELLQQPESLADLPSKKELLRRARSVLAKAPLPRLAQAKGPGTQGKAANGENGKEKTPDYGYSVLDLSDPNNALLVELFRSVTKVSLADSSGHRKNLGNRLIGYIRQEVAERKKELGLLASKLQSNDAKKAATKMVKIEGHINSLLGFVNSQPTQVKNVIRVMLHVPPQKPRTESENMFPVTLIAKKTGSGPGKGKGTKSPKSSASRKRGAVATSHGSTSENIFRKKPKRLNTACPAGDSEIADAMTKANDYKSKGLVDPSPDEIWLNSLETLLLTVVLSTGIPVWTDNWRTTLSDNGVIQEVSTGHDTRLFWQGVARVHEAAARLWKQRAESKFASRLRQFEEQYGDFHDSSPEKVAFLERLGGIEDDAKAKIRAFNEARGFLAQPQKLAMKCIMLVEALATKSGMSRPTNRGPKKSIQALNNSELGLGPYVHQWLRDETACWAHSFGIVDNLGRPQRYTAFDFLAEERTTHPFECASVLSKKACRMIYNQVAQQTRARSIFLRHDPLQVKDWIERSILTMAQNGDVWEYEPRWWGELASNSTVIDQDYALLLNLVRSGWSGIEEELLNNLPGENRAGEKVSRAAVQLRANQLVRELHQVEESNMAIAARERVARDQHDIQAHKPATGRGSASRQKQQMNNDSSDDEIELIGVKRPGDSAVASLN